MDDAVEFLGGGHAPERFGVGEVDVFEVETVSEIFPEPREPGALQRRIVIIVEIVDADDACPALEQNPRGGGADEARCSGYKYGHARGHRGCSRAPKGPRA